MGDGSLRVRTRVMTWDGWSVVKICTVMICVVGLRDFILGGRGDVSVHYNR